MNNLDVVGHRHREITCINPKDRNKLFCAVYLNQFSLRTMDIKTCFAGTVAL